MEYFENAGTIAEYIIRPESITAVAIAVAVYLALLFARGILERIVKQQVGQRDSVWLYLVLKSITGLRKWVFAVVALFAGIQVFELPSVVAETAEVVLLISLVVQVATLLAVALEDVLMAQFNVDGDETRRSALRILAKIGAGIIWALALLFTLSNLGINTTSLIAGLGVGGIAVALALQGILSDLLSAFTVFFDRPFEVGDFVGYQGKHGTVKSVGIMTTRIELLSGEELVVTNQDLTTNMLENYTRLTERRVAFSFGTVYELSADTVASIPEMVKEIVESRDHVRFDRAHFKEFGDSALLFEVVYYVVNPDYTMYMNIQQEINLELMRRFEEKEISLAYPTQTVHVKQEAA